MFVRFDVPDPGRSSSSYGIRFTLVVNGARRVNNDHARGEWVRRIVGRLDKRRVKVLFAQL